MTKRVLFICSLAVTIVIALYCFSKDRDNHRLALKEETTRLEEPPSMTDPQIAFPSHNPQSSVSRATDFDTSERLEKLQAQILDNGAFISPRKRRESFQASGLDTRQNVLQAMTILSNTYSDKPSKDEVLTRVLALHLLRYSKHLEETECVGMLGSLETQYQAAPNPQIKRATLFDFGSVAYACARFDSPLVERHIQDSGDLALKAQAKNAQTVYSDELSND